ncbi:hypothetical protein [Actinomadura geliboluensis]|uniref:hypothetical protein n=1 Tax=Actinomadura geliboluensis TaxID=882440 RepID=UPI00260638C9|nr:hypothetical protein [Actinomadura geliboluensis]
MADPTPQGETFTPDPDPHGARPKFLHAIGVMLHLTTRLDLPIVKWEVAPDRDWSAGGREQFPTLRAHIWHAPQGAAAKLAALNVWAREFGGQITEDPYSGQIQAHARFSYRDVPVDIVAVYDPDPDSSAEE